MILRTRDRGRAARRHLARPRADRPRTLVSEPRQRALRGGENSRESTLVPWRPVIEKELGRYVSGIPFGDSFSWEVGRQRSRGLDIGM
jgi:hypothetical protein